MKIVQTPLVISVILGIIGATSAKTIGDVDRQTSVHVSIIISAIVVLIIFLLTAGAAVGRRVTHRGESILIRAVAFSLPLLLIRVIYSLAGAFGDDERFNPISGSTT